jgi:sterol 24-C-methyltransferase
MDLYNLLIWLGVVALFITYRNWLIGAITRTSTLVRGFAIQKDEEAKHGVEKTGETIAAYVSLHEKDRKDDRTKNYAWFVNAYYNVSTIFYEWAWGSSFHFAPRKEYETFKGAILRHEMRLADRLRIKEGQQVLDVGCGIGGPLTNIAKVTGASLTGLNNNAYQVSRANSIAKELGLEKQARFVKGDFCNMDFPENSFDSCYAIESTCHAPQREDVFSQVFKTLKPGGLFGGYEWVTTDRHDPKNPDHVRAAKNIEIGNGLPHLSDYKVVPEALRAVGFEVIEYEDFFNNRAGDHMPWWEDLEGSYLRPTTFQFTPIGRWILFYLLSWLERNEIAPKGVQKVSEMLHVGAEGLVAGGKMGTFTPGYWFLARKPETAH